MNERLRYIASSWKQTHRAGRCVDFLCLDTGGAAGARRKVAIEVRVADRGDAGRDVSSWLSHTHGLRYEAPMGALCEVGHGHF